MRKYDANDERAIRMEQLVREWTRSGLLEKAQEDRILPELKVDLRRTNSFFRLILLGFGLLIIWSSVLLAGVTFQLRDEAPIAVLCALGAAASFFLAEFLITQFHLYRFGIEEAAAVATVSLVALAVGVFASSWHGAIEPGFPICLALIAGSLTALAMYARFGYVYAAVASLLCMGTAAFATPWPPVVQRLACEGVCILVFLGARWKYRQSGDEFPGDEYRAIQAMAWLALYASFNLQLPFLRPIFRIADITGPFYWFTYVTIWIVPAAGLLLAVRERDRPLLDLNILAAFLTLATNKPYLGMERQTWDPILLGILLIAVALTLRRRLPAGKRSRFTVERLLSADKRRLSVVAAASVALHAVPQLPRDSAATRNLEPGGGRSGGAGASGSF